MIRTLLRRHTTALLFLAWLGLLALPLLDSQADAAGVQDGSPVSKAEAQQNIVLERFVRMMPDSLPDTAPEQVTNQSSGQQGQQSWHGADELDELPRPLVPLHSLFVFPERAARLGIRRALVLAEIDLDAEGRIAACRIVHGAGNGFDEEVLARLPGVRFAPGKKGGHPVAVRARLPVRFVLRSGS